MKNEMKEQISDYTAGAGRTLTDQVNSRRSDKQAENKPNTVRAKPPLSVICQLSSVICQLSSVICFVICLVGCEKTSDNAANNTPVAAQVSGSIVTETAAAAPGVKSGDGAATRAAGTAWTVDDRIGVTATSTGATAYANIEYRATTTGGAFEVVNGADSDNTIYFQDREDVTFTAYYPYAGTNGTAPGTKGVISVTIAATDPDVAGQAQTDFLFATATGSAANPDVQFRFRHCMSRIVLNFLPGDGIAALSDIRYTIGALALQGTFDTRTGKAQGGTTAAGNLSRSVPFATPEMSSPLIVFPQEEADAGGILLTVTMKNIDYTATIRYPENPENHNVRELLPGHSYLYRVKVNQTRLTVEAPSIVEWENGNGADGEEVAAKQESKDK